MKPLRHKHLRDFRWLRNRAQKPLWPHKWPHSGKDFKSHEIHAIMITTKYPGVAQLVGRHIWDVEAARSSRATRTKPSEIGWFQRVFLWLLRRKIFRLTHRYSGSISSWRYGFDSDSHGSEVSDHSLFSFGLLLGPVDYLSASGPLLSFGIRAKGCFFAVMLLIWVMVFHLLIFVCFFLHLFLAFLRHLPASYMIWSSILGLRIW